MQTSESTILVVDDDPVQLEAACCLLQHSGYDTIPAQNCREAHRLFKRDQVDLALIDIMLPDGSGVELLQHWQQIAPETPLIMVTGLNQISKAIECFKLGAADYINKPIDPRRLRDCVREALDLADRRHETQHGTKRNGHPSSIAGYAIERVIGEGSMGVVYLAQGPGPDGRNRHFAMKVLKRLTAGDPHALLNRKKRFFSEARATLAVKHPNVIRIYDYGTRENNMPFILMEYFVGDTLEDLTTARTLSLGQKCRILEQLAEALAAIHQVGICHRDLKPANVLVNDGLYAKLMDFGIARLRDSSLTETTDVFGTPAYLSPEGFNSAKVDHRSDIFSFGSLAYKLFTGQAAFAAENIPAIANKVAYEDPVWPRQLNPDFPKSLDKIIRRTLRKEPGKRYQSAAAVLQDLHAAHRKLR